ncbi:MAG: hypothetical protein M3245_04815, partial [Actinomycetota bacterium]|nr:hypothetical protein [Actinomycetota bacterium]
APCTMHSWQMQPERHLALGGLYAGGTWVLDPSKATQPGGGYAEYDFGGRKTTWGTTVANVRDAADFVNATQWLPFDTETPAAIAGGYDRLVFTNGWFRGLDIYRYTGDLPKKLSRLAVDVSSSGGAVTGKLDRYAVLTHEGWRNKPLAGERVQVSAGGSTVTVTTAADGSFSADLGLGAGSHQVTVTWAGNDRFAENTVSQTVTG